MISQAGDIRLQASARSELRLRSGDFVSLEVIKRLTGEKWAVALQGRVLPARANASLGLQAGQRLRAQVLLEGGQVLLRLAAPGADPGAAAARQLLLPASEAIAVALLRSGLAATPQHLGQVRELLERLRLDPRRFARLAALLLEKGIDVRSSGVAELLAVLGHGQQEAGAQGQERRFRGRHAGGEARELAQGLREIVEQGEADSSVQVFNHLRGRDGTWVIVPYSLECAEGQSIAGSIRLLYDETKRATTRAVITSRVERAGEPSALWSFHLQRQEDGLHLACYCDQEAAMRAARGQLPELERKLGNLGVKADDIIRKDDAFDGFAPPGEDVPYRAIDTVG